MNLAINQLDLELDGADLKTSDHPIDSLNVSLFSGDWVGRLWGDYNQWADIQQSIDDEKVKKSVEWYNKNIEINKDDQQYLINIKEN